MWNKLFAALIAAMVPILMKMFEEWLKELNPEQLAAIAKEAADTIVT